MRKIVAFILCLLLASSCAFAEGGLTMIVDTDESSFLISEDGTLLTEPGEYDVIYCFTYDPCEPERLMYAVTTFAGGANYDEYSQDADFDVEEWPEDGGDLPAEDDSEIVDDDLEFDGATGLDGEWEIVEGDETDIDEWSEDWTEEDFYDFEGDFFDSLYAVMNARGELITDFDYITFSHDVKNAVIFATRADGFIDALDEQGNVLVSGEYAAMTSDGNGGYFATKPDLNQVDEYGDFPAMSALVHVAADGSEEDTGYVTGTYELGVFDSGYLCVPLYAETPSQDEADAGLEEDEYFEDYEYYDYEVMGYVFLNSQGKNAFDKVFDYATMFIGGYAEVEDENGAARLINANGEYVTEKNYSGFDRDETGDTMPIIANLVGGGFELLDRGDLHVIASFGSEYGNDLFATQAGGNFIMATSDSSTMIMDAAGRVLYTSQEDDVYAYAWYVYCEGQPERILVSRGDWPSAQCSLMDLDGNVVGGTYPELTALSWKDGQGRYMVADFDVVEVDYDGEKMLDADYDTYFYGLIDQDGNTILETKYTMINCISADRFWVSDGSVYQLVDENGAVIYEAE
jgi:hypothetical protein